MMFKVRHKDRAGQKVHLLDPFGLSECKAENGSRKLREVTPIAEFPGGGILCENCRNAYKNIYGVEYV